jgi:hypothetical protein
MIRYFNSCQVFWAQYPLPLKRSSSSTLKVLTPLENTPVNLTNIGQKPYGQIMANTPSCRYAMCHLVAPRVIPFPIQCPEQRWLRPEVEGRGFEARPSQSPPVVSGSNSKKLFFLCH